MALPYFRERPIYTAEASAFPESDAMVRALTRLDRFGDPYTMYKRAADGRLWVPRNCAPLGTEDRRTDGTKCEPLSVVFEPRSDEQLRVYEEIVRRATEGRSFIVRAPTGFGKTAVTVAAIAALGIRTMVVVPKEDLLRSWRLTLKKLAGIDDDVIGLVQENTCKYDHPVVLGSLKSLAMIDRYPAAMYRAFGLLVIDEVHRIGADVMQEVCWRFPARLRIGLSATPRRRDGREPVLLAHIGPVEVSTEENPSTFKVLRYRTTWKCPKHRDFDPELGHWVLKPVPHSPGRVWHIERTLVNHAERNALITRLTRAAYTKKRRTAVFITSRKHIPILTAAFAGAGIPVADIGVYVGGRSEKQLAEAARQRVMLVTWGMMAEGTDIPWLDTLLFATPRADVEQATGRALRQWRVCSECDWLGCSIEQAESHAQRCPECSAPLTDKREPVVLDLIDGDSHVFREYASKRSRFYLRKRAAVKDMWAGKAGAS